MHGAACNHYPLDWVAVKETSAANPRIRYRERQWVPLYWWVAAAFFVALAAGQLSLNRPWYWSAIAGTIFGAAAIWTLISLSKTEVVVEEVDDEVWLHVGPAHLPADVISRTTVVPGAAKSAAMGRQLDPAAYVVSHAWVPEMVMLVLDDPDDPTPYWLIAAKNPDALLAALGRPIVD